MRAYRAGYLLGAAFALAGVFLALLPSLQPESAPAFFGEMWLPLNAPSRLVVRPVAPDIAEDKPRSLHTTHAAGRDLLRVFPETPPQIEDNQQLYETLELPFSVTLRNIEFEEGPSAPAELRIQERNAREQTVPVEKASPVVVDERTFTMREIRPWGGIIPEPAESGGTPLAVVALRLPDGRWMEDIVAQNGDWLSLNEDVVFRFEWVESEKAAAASLARDLPGIESAKWGVEDNGAMNWFDSFVIGSGLELKDGTTVVLAEVKEPAAADPRGDTALRFKVVGDGAVGDVWVPANGASEDGLLRFSYPTLAPHVLRAFSWEPDVMLIQSNVDGQESKPFILNRGEIKPLDAAQCAIRLDQVYGSAIYLRREDSPLSELVLESPGRVVRLRQGETARLGETMVEFRPPVKELSPVYSVDIGPSGSRQNLQLHRETVVSFDGWTFQQAAESVLTKEWATLYVEWRPPSAVVKLGVVLLVASTGICVLSAFQHARYARRCARMGQTT